MMHSHVKKVTSACLVQQQEKSWMQFSAQHPNATDQLSAIQLEHFKSAIMLSDYILKSALQAPDIVIEVFVSNYVYQKDTPNYQKLINDFISECITEEDLHKALRLFRLREMVAIATADLVLNIPLNESLKRLSILADVFVQGALDWLSQFCYEKWGEPKNSEGETIPLLVYAMGKLGGKELNFSSDIDLIFTYPESGETQGARRSIDNQQFFTRLGQKLITALNQQTADGFVYRVDMRLRPFGDSGPLVLTFNAMEDYYQEQGRDWERYAMLKARLIGEGKYHDQLDKMLKPFVYRRYIDFSVIDSLRRMKMMIAQEVRRKQLINNIKLGAGGIREIEFIVQVFQLIRGGQVKSLQQRNLLTVLPLLVEEGEVPVKSMKILKNAYEFLRRVENIIQALGDKQTQTLPDSELDQMRILAALEQDELSTWPLFLEHLQFHMYGVHKEFIALIGEESSHHHIKDSHWVTLWDSDWDHEESCTWISKVNQTWKVDSIWHQISDFREDLTKKGIGNRGRQTLDKLMPLLLFFLNENNVEDTTLERLLSIFKKIVTRTAYLELLNENEGALKHLIKLCRSSLWVTEHIAKFPILLDELIDPTLFSNPPLETSYGSELRETMLRIPEEDLEAQMNMLRQFKQVQHLRLAAADISGVLPITKISDHLTAIAECIITEVINLAWAHVTQRFGQPLSTVGTDDKGLAVIGYGKMGGIELGYGSDLDLVFLHNSLPSDMTNGEKEVPASQFYAKLAQRIMHIFNTNMASGILYELDMRLRPSGNSGLLAVHIDTFEEYQKQDAWTWEHQALVRTRCVYGTEFFVKRYEEIKRNIIASPRDHDVLKKDVVEMRQKMKSHLDKSTEDLVDIKQGEGGLVDIEFLAQYLVLSHGYKHPSLGKYSDNINIFNELCALSLISEEDKDALISSYCHLRDFGHKATLQGINSLIINSEFTEVAKNITSIKDRYLV
ncbi:bifunctional [glutamate--ammonia ligase]-adenylyl-L-tyrosine phosphorylase/[glutamate--ammonia-ligase] adenylyltransferase [Colwellia sp. UCD-KL20]|uniref:bifunctional [glutamate--ammonia ligase]-adenylyl-L-tyrosine phosphorylase/[glutamate--ammonia-ligase] adenylyltransferase n=1 Tax=Colwellia sp. UCD-KL20 TaxID=1917165 RepID=UPI0025710C24|nr:bifunctional [glutamate--ammonia ligase]-adenylyl-L-tyrosine phosphorylase/[glutamate--ammonia-ligase] adenylyltransferase [Colwellia sp. UCD-KL20]